MGERRRRRPRHHEPRHRGQLALPIADELRWQVRALSCWTMHHKTMGPDGFTRAWSLSGWHWDAKVCLGALQSSAFLLLWIQESYCTSQRPGIAVKLSSVSAFRR